MRRLVEDGVVPAGPVVAAADWLPELVIAAEPGLLAELGAGRSRRWTGSHRTDGRPS